jgi:hypothetical protein
LCDIGAIGSGAMASGEIPFTDGFESGDLEAWSSFPST